MGYGLSLAQQAGAHATVQAVSIKLVLSSAGVSKLASGLVHAENCRLDTLAQAAARSAAADAAAAGVNCSTESPHLSYSELVESFRRQARVHDLTIIDAEPESGSLDRGLFEALLMQSGRPIVVVPPNRSAFSARRVIVAWDGSGRAARSANDALPFLRAAEAVEIVTVGDETDPSKNVDGAELAPHLARDGIKVDVNDVAARDGDVAQTLRDRAALYSADLIVMGGYVHSRLRELVFGGVTQSLLKSSPIPLFLSY